MLGVNFGFLKDNARRAVVVWFIRAFMFIKRARGIRCRDCGLEIPPIAVIDFVNGGCSCGSHKLELIR
jgi:hypothetical protein